MKIYSTTVISEGGRSGRVKSEDGILDLPLGLPLPFAKKTNPEQLFAAGYAACFENAMRHISKEHNVVLSDGQVSCKVSLHRESGGKFSLSAELIVDFPATPKSSLEEVVAHAHQICPYSNAVRGNIPVGLTIKD